jgi:apolipoprotein D and lipocalin family protein
MWKRLFLPLAAACGLVNCSNQESSKAPLRTVERVDLPRFMGDWFVYAHIPYWLEKGKVGTLDRYTLRPDGRIDNVFLFRKGSLDAPLQEWRGVARVVNQETNAEWRVRFLWPFEAAYLIIDLDPDYQWAVVGHPGRKLAWVLSRQPELAADIYAGILDRLAAQGYDPELLSRVPQLASQP